MKLVWFLIIGSFFATYLGEFGKLPFGGVVSVGLIDVLVFLTVVSLVVWHIFKKKRFVLPNEFKLLLGFWILAGLSLILFGRLEGVLYLLRFVFYSSFFWVGSSLVKFNKKYFGKILDRVVLAGVVLSLIGFFQILIFPELDQLRIFGYDPHKNRLVATFLDPNFLGSFLNISLLVGLYRYFQSKDKKELVWVSILLTAIILTFSRSAYLMLIVEIVMFSLLTVKKLLVLLVGLLVLFYLVIPQFRDRIEGGFSLDKSASERFYSWQTGWEVFKMNPVFGVGFNNLGYVVEQQKLWQVHQNKNTHSLAGVDSSFLFVLATTGIIGFIIYLSFWILVFWKSVGSSNKILVVPLLLGLLINSQFINSLFYPEIMLVYFLLLGSAAALSD